MSIASIKRDKDKMPTPKIRIKAFNLGVPGSNPGGLIKMGMVEKPFPFFFPCLVTRRGTVVL